MAEELTPRRSAPPGGRNKREAGGRRHVTKVLMNDAEFQMVQGRAVALGISVPRALIEAAIGVPPLTKSERAALNTELTGLKHLLGNLTNNVNQIAAALNSDVSVPAVQIRAVLARAEAAAARVEELAQEYRA
ncbi:hypothetical protein [Streptomyces sp. NPDC018045]|uniref:hypothetical protein n=1 Tax=Streptomyces sp. NPDC018045 TaxID=3365037 RepID=UPI0037B14800